MLCLEFPTYKLNSMGNSILIINDNRDMLHVLEMIFIHHHFHVDICDLNADVDHHLEKLKPDLVILGFYNPDSEEKITSEQFKKARSRCEAPFVVLSADQNISGLMGNNVYIVNPFNLFFLLNEVKRIFKKKIIN